MPTEKFVCHSLFSLSVLVVGAILSVHAVSASVFPKTFAVIGIRNEIENESMRARWEDELIGFGLCDLLAQRLFDTGRYRPVEDNPEIIREIHELVGSQWKGARDLFDMDEADRVAERLNVEAVAFARITEFSVSRSRGFIGIFSRAKSTVHIEVEVSLKEFGGPEKRAAGRGEAATESTALLFRIRNHRVYFDETAVGRAARQAIENAVDNFWK
jgi:hypothetical protein